MREIYKFRMKFGPPDKVISGNGLLEREPDYRGTVGGIDLCHHGELGLNAFCCAMCRQRGWCPS